MHQSSTPVISAEPSAGTARGAGVRPALAALVLFAALAAFHTWPLASAPGTLSRTDSGDAVLNEWTIAWVAHQLVTDPVHLFDANIFYPERRTLAFSEHMLPQSLMVAPLLWAGETPVLAHNVALLLGLVLTAWTMFLVARRWTGSWAAGAVAGSLAAFNAHSLTRLAHLQAQHLEFLPLAVFALDRLLDSPRVRHALSLAGWFTLQALTSGYFLAFAAVSMVAAAAARVNELTGARSRRAVPLALLAALVAGVLLLPFLLPYWQVRHEHQFVRPLEEVTRYSAVAGDYLATGSLIHWNTWSRPFFRGDALFPGLVALLLAGTSVGTAVAFRDRRARMWLAIAAVTFCLSFGTYFPPYVWLYRTLPLFEGIRGAVRFGQMTLLAIAALAAWGTAWWLSKVRAGRGRIALAAALVVLVNAEAWRGPLFFNEFRGIAPIFRTLAKTPPGAVFAYFPLYDGIELNQNARYMLTSTVNWRRMLNGYSGFTPKIYYQHAENLRGFPDRRSIDYLRQVGVTHVAVDSRNMSGPRLDALVEVPELQLWVTDGNLRVYVLR